MSPVLMARYNSRFVTRIRVCGGVRRNLTPYGFSRREMGPVSLRFEGEKPLELHEFAKS